jgi:hypothetical protein
MNRNFCLFLLILNFFFVVDAMADDLSSSGLPDVTGAYDASLQPPRPMPWLILLLDDDPDNDGMPEYWEIHHGLDPMRDDSGEDPDDDGLSNLGEFLNGTDPNNPDTDGDRMSDGWEVSFSLDPLSDDSSGDPDEDGYANYVEYIGGTDPDSSSQTPSPGEYYRYDAMGRVARASHILGSDIQYEIEYVYDFSGNRTRKVIF